MKLTKCILSLTIACLLLTAACAFAETISTGDWTGSAYNVFANWGVEPFTFESDAESFTFNLSREVGEDPISVTATKTGDGTWSISDGSELSGTMTAADGVLTIKYTAPFGDQYYTANYEGGAAAEAPAEEAVADNTLDEGKLAKDAEEWTLKAGEEAEVTFRKAETDKEDVELCFEAEDGKAVFYKDGKAEIVCAGFLYAGTWVEEDGSVAYKLSPAVVNTGDWTGSAYNVFANWGVEAFTFAYDAESIDFNLSREGEDPIAVTATKADDGWTISDGNELSGTMTFEKDQLAIKYTAPFGDQYYTADYSLEASEAAE